MTHVVRAPFPSYPWDAVIAWCAAVAVAAVVAVLAFTTIPAIAAEADARVSDGVHPVAVGDAEILVPDGWVVTGGPDDLGVRTPDGGLVARVHAVDGDPEAALRDALEADLGAVPTATIGPFRSELLASGSTAVHADVGSDAVYAVVSDGTDAVVLIVARAAEGRAIADYRAALGLLLEGVRA